MHRRWIHRRPTAYIAVACCSLCFFPTVFLGSLSACQVPVFRYALERWSPDLYEVLVITQGPLPSEMMGWLAPLTEQEQDYRVPLRLRLVDVSAESDPVALELWQRHELKNSAPLLVALYPKRSGYGNQVAHVCELTRENAKLLVSSPVRRELIHRLTSGHTAVWFFVESGDSQKDARALETLENQLAADEKRLELPTAEAMEVTDATLDSLKIPLQIKFSVLRVKRDDPSERFLINCLLNSEEDLHEYGGEPLTFPVFGRGIVLYALVGNGIAGDLISAATKFIVGPCSCQVKEQNPGFDLLLDCNWEAEVGSSLISIPVPSVQSAPRLLTIPPGKKDR
jgi:hypothetical protein